MSTRRRNAVLAIALALPLTACSPEPGDEAWCNAIKGKPVEEITLQESKDFMKFCLVESRTIGSKSWCENLEERPKSQWNFEEVSQYTKHCVITEPKDR